MRIALLAAIVLLTGCDSFGGSTTSVRGTVVDARTGAPLAGIPVALEYNNGVVGHGDTGIDGSFSLIHLRGGTIQGNSTVQYSFSANVASPLYSSVVNRAYESYFSSPRAGRTEVVVRLEPTGR